MPVLDAADERPGPLQLDLRARAQVDDEAEAVRLQRLDVALGQPLQVVGAHEHALARHAAAGERQPTEVARVHRAVERQPPPHRHNAGMPTLAELAEQEARLQFDAFDNLTAWELGSVMRREAVALGLPISIEIRRNGQVLFHAALSGTAPDNDAWLLRKARVVDRYGLASYHVGEQARQDGKSFEVQSR